MSLPAETVAATVLDLLERSGALRVAALVEHDGGTPMLVDVAVGDSAEVIDAGGQRTVDPAAGVALELADVAPPAGLAVDADAGTVSAGFGEVEAIAEAVRRLAGTLGGRSVVTATWETQDPDLPLTLAAREGEALLVVIGEREFRAPDGWPARGVDVAG